MQCVWRDCSVGVWSSPHDNKKQIRVNTHERCFFFFSSGTPARKRNTLLQRSTAGGDGVWWWTILPWDMRPNVDTCTRRLAESANARLPLCVLWCDGVGANRPLPFSPSSFFRTGKNTKKRDDGKTSPRKKNVPNARHTCQKEVRKLVIPSVRLNSETRSITPECHH